MEAACSKARLDDSVVVDQVPVEASYTSTRLDFCGNEPLHPPAKRARPPTVVVPI